jgi:ABC-type transporter MlaC component
MVISNFARGRSVALGLDGHNDMLKVSAMPIPTPMILLYLLSLSIFFFAPLGSSAEEAEAVAESSVSAEAAGQRVDEFHSKLLEIMKEAGSLGFDGRAKRLQALLPDYIDQDYMAKKALGRKWKKLTPEQQTNLLEAFGVLNVYSYADRFNGYSGEEFETDRLDNLQTLRLMESVYDAAGGSIAL